jgi:hypothetical protein
MDYEGTMVSIKAACATRPITFELALAPTAASATTVAAASGEYERTFNHSYGCSLGIGFAPHITPQGVSASAEVTVLKGIGAKANISTKDVLIAVNGKSSAKLSFDKTMALLRSASRPTTLRFRSATAASKPQQPQQQWPATSPSQAQAQTPPTFKCYTLQDPTGAFPDSVALVVTNFGVQVVQPQSHATVCFWSWKRIANYTPGQQSTGKRS